jgi:hypothetical protein
MDLRVRNEYYNNLVTLDQGAPLHEQDVVRFRGRIWTSLAPVTNVTLNARLSAEPRLWVRPSFVGSHLDETGMEWRYGIADGLNVRWQNVMDLPLTVVAGRQDMAFGDYYNWWLVLDGTPLDGSWSLFLDGIRVTYELKDLETRLDAVYIHQNALNDEWVSVIGGREALLTEQDEEGVILYGSNKTLKNTAIDGYFIYKGDRQAEFDGRLRGDNADIYTVGGKVTGLVAEHWRYSVEGAYQFGSKRDPAVRVPVAGGGSRRDIDAYGSNVRLSYLVKDAHETEFSLVGEYLTGDDPGTVGTDEMFDVLWGRWPRWSELYIYSYIPETGGRIAQLNNIVRVGAEWTQKPMPGMSVCVGYNALFAPQEVPTRRLDGASAQFSEEGHFRGHYVQAILRQRFSRHVQAHLWAEAIWQGNFYVNRELLSFLRAEVQLTF